MQKPQYELVPLKVAVAQHRTNIAAFQKGIADEESHIEELQNYIRQWEEYKKEISQNGDNLRPNK